VRKVCSLFIISALALALVVACGKPQTPSAPSAEPTAGAPPPAQAAPPDVPVALKVYSNRTQYLLGEPVQLYLLFTNLTDAPVKIRSDYFLDKALNITITPAHGQPWRFIDRYHTGITLPNVTELGPREARGFYIFLAHSDLPGHDLPFPEAGLYRVDTEVATSLNENRQRLDIIRSEPVTIQVVDSVHPEERAAAEIFERPAVARAVQAMQASDELEAPLEEVLRLAPNSAFAEHADFLLATIAMGRSEYLKANEYLYPVYYREDGYYPKDFILINIMTNFHFGEEPEKALAVCRVLVDLFPRIVNRNNPLVSAYVSRFIAPGGAH
jgi:hypothetical protein